MPPPCATQQGLVDTSAARTGSTEAKVSPRPCRASSHARHVGFSPHTPQRFSAKQINYAYTHTQLYLYAGRRWFFFLRTANGCNSTCGQTAEREHLQSYSCRERERERDRETDRQTNRQRGTCFYHLRRLRQVFRCAGYEVTVRLVFPGADYDTP